MSKPIRLLVGTVSMLSTILSALFYSLPMGWLSCGTLWSDNLTSCFKLFGKNAEKFGYFLEHIGYWIWMHTQDNYLEIQVSIFLCGVIGLTFMLLGDLDTFLKEKLKFFFFWPLYLLKNKNLSDFGKIYYFRYSFSGVCLTFFCIFVWMIFA